MSFDFSKITQSISIGAVNAVKKTTELYEIGKINLSIQSEKKEIRELEEKIGHIIYKSYKNKIKKDKLDEFSVDPGEKVLKLCKKIDEHWETIESLNKDIEKIKNSKHCNECGMEIPQDSDECPYCNDYKEN
ncbi:MAG: hypothetical protein GX895_01210 [Clostridiales bacterium]|uniref:hypothetical protein n=1 Tax=Clostridium sp. N3C TaxID=1776758 RepID=UPI00092E169B|nr:hypothetical protein [Clostridium sp. N3C]NLZ47403.1 hypothetical protein [Clostridiales bacterium]SCN25852.1 hypothetical protein N3C_2555 [Clostridium sp. N3C]